ncbi:DUF2778 domain-containing protein [Microvirga sp. CF3016]|uniref:DUF2778 domain-containing protein n=1 Tax=Microvirga sp. CF3016 TaxID=3110181 RepID=UPI002E78DBFE|nr:DUF2778 domain-containing protein [Microvirga sp. CF3016]MEE1613513.1 DUF2778 domain-containing protein [Microvirga sp. CF3016]
MLHKSYPSGGRAPRSPRRKRRNLFPTAVLVAISMSPLAYFVDFHHERDDPPVEHVSSVAAPARQMATYDPALVDPTPLMKTEALHLNRNAPLHTAFAPPVQRQASVAPSAPPPEAPAAPAPVQVVAEAAQPVIAPVPLPAPRPADLLPSKPAVPTQLASVPARSPMTQRAAITASAAVSAPVDNRSFIEKLFGVKPSSPPDAALSYAALDNGTGSISPTSRFVPAPESGAGTAVYDITAQVVIMPNGERLEAHSGLGDMMDNPRYVNVRMKGATPPGTYVITERERLFHGVRALRLTPVGGSPAIYGRDGILAHTYMLGPRGDSNGCVSFKNYDRFLQAYLRGEVKRLIVTAGRGQDLLPRMVNRSNLRRSARAI